MHVSDRIYVAGHRGLVGSAITRRLKALGYHNLLLRERSELDLVDQSAVRVFFARERPKHVFLAAAKVGGINANNTYRGEFMYQNLMPQTNVIHAAYEHDVARLVFLGSSCVYPRDCPQPMREEYLLTGPLEPTNEPYAVAKIAGLKMCEAYNAQYGTEFVSVMPTNLYGVNDNFDLESSHVLPAIMRKVDDAKQRKSNRVVLWGTGKPLREFLHVDDLADACIFVASQEGYTDMVNIGSGSELSILEVAGLICDVIGFDGDIEFDARKPDGVPRKLLDCTRLNSLGWHPKIELREGLETTYAWFRKHVANGQQDGAHL